MKKKNWKIVNLVILVMSIYLSYQNEVVSQSIKDENPFLQNNQTGLEILTGTIQTFIFHRVNVPETSETSILTFEIGYKGYLRSSHKQLYAAVLTPNYPFDESQNNTLDFHQSPVQTLELNKPYFFDDYDSFAQQQDTALIQARIENMRGEWIIIIYDINNHQEEQIDYQIKISISKISLLCPNCDQTALCYKSQCLCESNKIGRFCNDVSLRPQYQEKSYQIIAPQSWFYFSIEISDFEKEYAVRLLNIDKPFLVSVIFESFSRAYTPNQYNSIQQVDPSDIIIFNLHKIDAFQDYQLFILQSKKTDPIKPRMIVGINNLSEQRTSITLISQTNQDQNDEYQLPRLALALMLVFIAFVIIFSLCFYWYQSTNAARARAGANDRRVGIDVGREENLILENNNNIVYIQVGVSHNTADKYMPIIQFEKAIEQYPDMKEEISCVVCLINFEKEDDCRITLCFHIFHSECLLQWFKQHPTCPSCRKQLNQKAIQSDQATSEFDNPYIRRMKQQLHEQSMLAPHEYLNKSQQDVSVNNLIENRNINEISCIQDNLSKGFTDPNISEIIDRIDNSHRMHTNQNINISNLINIIDENSNVKQEQKEGQGYQDQDDGTGPNLAVLLDSYQNDEVYPLDFIDRRQKTNYKGFKAIAETRDIVSPSDLEESKLDENISVICQNSQNQSKRLSININQSFDEFLPQPIKIVNMKRKQSEIKENNDLLHHNIAHFTENTIGAPLESITNKSQSQTREDVKSTIASQRPSILIPGNQQVEVSNIDSQSTNTNNFQFQNKSINQHIQNFKKEQQKNIQIQQLNNLSKEQVGNKKEKILKFEDNDNPDP